MNRERFLCLTSHGGRVHTSIYYDEPPRVREEDRPFTQLYRVAESVEDEEIFKVWELGQTLGYVDKDKFLPVAGKTTTKPLGD